TWARSPERNNPWSTNTHVSWSPTARCTSAAATAESTPPDSPHGQQILSRFLHEFAGIGAAWTPANIADALVEQVREQIGDG
ncbi:hypothetical protein C6A85_11485, partial [Mycobacterium sp. ITM-2017-0098]